MYAISQNDKIHSLHIRLEQISEYKFTIYEYCNVCKHTMGSGGAGFAVASGGAATAGVAVVVGGAAAAGAAVIEGGAAGAGGAAAGAGGAAAGGDSLLFDLASLPTLFV